MQRVTQVSLPTGDVVISSDCPNTYFFIRNVPPDQLFQVESFLEILKTLLIFPALSVGSEYAI